MKEHRYSIALKWTGNLGYGTDSYDTYSREHVIRSEGKDDIMGSSDASFNGDSRYHNPEELLLSSIASCHMLWYLHLCSANGIVVTSYKDQPEATMIEQKDGSGAFEQATLNPKVEITDGIKVHLAKTLHGVAHKMCFIANSLNFEIVHNPTIIVNEEAK